MYLKRGDYTHPLNDAALRWRVLPVYADNLILYGQRVVVHIKGMLEGANASAISTAMSNLENAYASTSGNLVLLENDGTTETHLKITGSDTVGGIRLIRLEFPTVEEGEFVSYVTYEIEVEAGFGGTSIFGGGNSGQSTILRWSESLSFRGNGGPRTVIHELRNGPPRKQQVSQFTPIYATQAGEGVGLFRHPTAPGPIWRQYEDGWAREIRYHSADTVGGGSGSGLQQQERQFRTTWSYSFSAPQPLQASPGLGF